MKKMTPLKIVFIFLIASQLWIILTDLLLARVATSPEMITRFSMIKGGLYVAIAGLFLYWLVSRYAAERIRAEDAQQISDQQLRIITDTVPAYIAFVGLDDLRYKFVNTKFEQSFGMPRNDIIGRHIRDVIGESNYQFALKYIDEVRSSRRQVSYENVFNLKQGKRWINVTYVPTFDQQNRMVGLIVLSIDISEYKKAEQQLRESEKIYHNLFNNTQIAMFRTRLDGLEILDVNDKFLELIGRTRDEVIGKPSMIHWVDPGRREEMVRTLKEKRHVVDFELQILNRKGEVRDCITSLILYPEEEILDGSILDITDRKKAEEKLTISERQLKESQRIALIGHYTLDIPSGIWTSSEALDNIFGIGTQYVRSIEGWLSIVHPDEQAAMLRYFTEEVLDDKVPFNRQYRIKRKSDGAVRWVHGLGNLTLSSGGKLISMFGTIQDITERKQAEEAIVSAAREWQASFDAMSDGISIHSSDHTIINANQALSRILGRSREELIGKKCYQVFHGMENPIDGCPLEGTKETNMTAFSEIFEPMLNKWLEVSTSPVLDHAGRVMNLVHIVRDVTSRKHAEEEHRKLEGQLQHARQLEGIGQLAGGIAHDFNNVLSAIVGFAGLLQMKMGKGDPLRRFADEIEAAARRGAALTHQILAISRRQVLNIKPVNLNEIIRNLEEMLHRLVREDINIEVNLSDKDLVVLVDASQMDQILINLAANARDAMPKGGRLSIATEPFVMSRDFIQKHGYGSPGEYALLTVSDTGSGMDAETRTKIFEPFFTTKEIGKGTGLGLAVVHGIVKQHGGFIDLYSELENGTSIKIYLPLTVYDAERTEIKHAVEVQGGTETILMAEDDPTLRQLSATVLSHYGYTVIEAVDGEDAIQKFIENREKINCVILDGIMPKKNGKEVLDEIRRICPEMKFIFVSGYAEDIFTHDGIPDDAAVFLHKPVTTGELIHTLRAVLDK
jgi:two-component system cell cycle sensor histidine kinase/response regulator CckA